MFSLSIPTASGPKSFTLAAGSTAFFVGANGGGKTRLAVYIESTLGERAHRISAHRALSLNPKVPKLNEADAIRGLRYGYHQDMINVSQRSFRRWGQQDAIGLLNDYDYLVQALFAEQSNAALKTHKSVRAGKPEQVNATKFEKLVEIWDRVLPHRTLDITGDDIQVIGNGSGVRYAAPQMSDGERAVFYLIGQTLTAAANGLIIFDEPELHIHRSILARLWDELEAARPDCGMVMISHDLEFVATRKGQKFVLRDYAPATGWQIDDVPEDTGFSEELVTLILGSRRPVLFVEGAERSLDQAIYRACFPDLTIIPRGSCEEVIRAVITMRANASLTRVSCAGIVDADDYGIDEAHFLASKGISILPVSEIENLFLLPNVIEAILALDGHAGDQLKAKRDELLNELFSHADDPKNQESCILRYCRRRIDRTIKKIDLSGAVDVTALVSAYLTKTTALNIHSIATNATNAITLAVREKDAATLLKWYDNKGLMGIAAKAKGTTKPQFEQWILRALRNGTAPAVASAIRMHLPAVNAV